MERTAHMINNAVSNPLMPKPVMATVGTPLVISYAFAVHQLVLSKLAANHFIGAINVYRVLSFCQESCNKNCA
jgi:hypothetical protein